MTPAVLYGAKSTADPHGSIPTQLADARALAEAEGLEVVEEFHDEAASAYHGDRGPGLARAMAECERLAAECGDCALIVQHSDRLARGSGRKGEARHLVEVALWALKHGVTIRSVQDGQTFGDLLYAVVTGQRNHEDSARKAKATAAGLQRAAEAGKPMFGIVPDGYRVLYEHDDAGRVTGRRMEKDPPRSELWDLVWRLAVDGWSERAIVLELDKRGWKTNPRKRAHRSRPFDANRLRLALAQPVYAGLQVHRGDVVGRGDWPAYVSVEDFERVRARRRQRDKPLVGRPPEGYVLARVARCGECGSPMVGVTGKARTDGNRPRRYVCWAHRERPQDCAAQPIDAAIVDRAFVANLTSFLGDVDAWRDRLVQTREVERARMCTEVERALIDATDLDKQLERLADTLSRHEGKEADLVLGAMRRKQEERERAERRLTAAQAAYEAAGADQGLDPLLDFYNGLSAELAGRVEDANGELRRLNVVCQDYFAGVLLTEGHFSIETGLREPSSTSATESGIRMVPFLREDVAARLDRVDTLRDEGLIVATGDERIAPMIPPLRAIDVPAGNASSAW